MRAHTDSFCGDRMAKGLLRQPQTRPDVYRPRKSVFLGRGVVEIGEDRRGDSCGTPINLDADTRPQRSTPDVEHLATKLVLLHITLKNDPELSKYLRQPRSSRN